MALCLPQPLGNYRNVSYGLRVHIKLANRQSQVRYLVHITRSLRFDALGAYLNEGLYNDVVPYFSISPPLDASFSVQTFSALVPH